MRSEWRFADRRQAGDVNRRRNVVAAQAEDSRLVAEHDRVKRGDDPTALVRGDYRLRLEPVDQSVRHGPAAAHQLGHIACVQTPTSAGPTELLPEGFVVQVIDQDHGHDGTT